MTKEGFVLIDYPSPGYYNDIGVFVAIPEVVNGSIVLDICMPFSEKAKQCPEHIGILANCLRRMFNEHPELVEQYFEPIKELQSCY